jgi:hypothetical protein
MSSEPIPSERTYRHVVEQPTLRRVVEHLTLVTLLLAVSLYAVGQFSTWRYISAFGIPTTGIERGWETYVFNGAVAVMNLLLNPSLSAWKWLLALGILLASWYARNRMSPAASPARRTFKRMLTACVGGSYIFLLLMLGIGWGAESAQLTKTSPMPPQHYVVVPEANPHMPKGFHEANAKDALRYVATGSDAIFLFDPGTQQTFAIPTRLIVCRVYEPLTRN